MRAGHFAFAYLALQAYLVNIANAQCPGNNVGWYVKWDTETCAENCDGGSPCGGCAMPWDTLYASAEMCCQNKLSRKHPGWCKAASEATAYNGSGNWYTKYEGAKCVKDCALADPSCGGIIEDAHVKLSNDNAVCCNANFNWVDEDLCVSNSNPASTGTNKWYAANPGGKCSRDCDGLGRGCTRVPDSHRDMYDTIEKCCAGAQSWVDEKYCFSRSVDSESTGWVVDSSSNTKCIKDSIAHNVPSAPIFDTPSQCCAAKLNWIDKDKCTADSQGIPYSTGEFYTDYAGKKCAQYCPETGNPGEEACGGDPPYATAPLFESAEECCMQTLSWLNLWGCVGRTHKEAPHSTNEWYAVWTPTPKCVRSCEVGPPDCGGLKENWQHGYGADAADKAACCSSMPWVPNCI